MLRESLLATLVRALKAAVMPFSAGLSCGGSTPIWRAIAVPSM